MNIIRVFPRRTKATPDDELAFIGSPGLFPPKADRIHISVSFTWDIPKAERMAEEWKHVGPIKLGGPAFGKPSTGEFIPGRYLKKGYVITSRGCPNRCWFCDVWRREGNVIELKIKDGWNVLDDNILACSNQHFAAVLKMLERQDRPAEFTGGLDASRLMTWHIEKFAAMKRRPRSMFFAYDTKDDFPRLVDAAHRLMKAGLFNRTPRIRAYVLVGYPGDTVQKAAGRIKAMFGLGIMPMAMLYQDHEKRNRAPEWLAFQKFHARPAFMRKEWAKAYSWLESHYLIQGE